MSTPADSKASATYTREARAFGRYLLGCDPSETMVSLYGRALERRGWTPSERDERIARFAVAHPWTISLLDGASAVSQPKSLLRRKLLLFTAIAEAQPEHARLFLPRDYPGGHWVRSGLELSWSACKLLTGRALLALL